MGCFDAPFISPNGEHFFDAASPYKMVVGPFTVRADGIKDEHPARNYVAQVVGVIRSLQAIATGKILVSSIASFKKHVLIFPYVPLDDDLDDGFGHAGADLAWTDARMGLFSVAVSYTPLFGQKLKESLGGDPSTFTHVFSPHEVLVHELVHVVREVSCNWEKLGKNEEELAILVTNIYSQEINRTVVTNYDEQDPVTNDLGAFSKEIYQKKYRMIEAFFKQNRSLAVELSRINVPFNPLRQYADENL